MTTTLLTKNRLLELIGRFESLPPIMVLGDIGIDKYTYGDVVRISPEAPVPILNVGKEIFKLGLAANVAHNLRELGVRATLCSIVGKDTNGQKCLQLMRDCHLSDEMLIRCPDFMTICKERIATKIQQICRIDYENVEELNHHNQEVIYKNISDKIEGHSALIIEDYGKGVISKKLLDRIIPLFKDHKKMIAVDPSRGSHPEIYKGIDVLKPNLKEAVLMTSALGFQEKNNLEKMAHILIDKLKLKKIVITLGDAGMCLLDAENNGKFTIIPTIANEVFDVSGAGDTAISLITSGLLVGGTLDEATWLGNFGSGVVVGKKGTATVTTKELIDFYDMRGKSIC